MLCKVSVDEVFMHYFEKMSASAPGPLWATFFLQNPSLPIPGKILWAPMRPNRACDWSRIWTL